jgi:WD40 repeat protein
MIGASRDGTTLFVNLIHQCYQWSVDHLHHACKWLADNYNGLSVNIVSNALWALGLGVAAFIMFIIRTHFGGHRKLQRIVPTSPFSGLGIVTAPALPQNYLKRVDAIAALREAIMINNESLSIAMTALHGMGGVGKTVLAQALCYDEAIQRRFPDGVIWIAVGRESVHDPVTRLREVGKVFGDDLAAYDTLGCASSYKTVIRDKAALIILDDVWSVRDLEPFNAESHRSHLLFTTRDKSLASLSGAKLITLGCLEPQQSREMLASWANLQANHLPPVTDDLIRECGGLALALAMIGAMVRSGTSWQDALNLLQGANLDAIEAQLFGYNPQYRTLLRAIGVSVDALESDDRDRYLNLAVFPEDQPIPEGALATLWKLDGLHTRMTMNLFVQRSLATGVKIGDDQTIILHDLLREYVRKRREPDLPDLNLRLVEAWDALPHPPDAYAWRWLGYHLVNANRRNELRRRLLDGGFTKAKLEATNVNALIADYDYFSDDPELCLIQGAICLSAHIIERDPNQFASQLVGRLIPHVGTPAIRDFAEALANAAPRPWLRPLSPALQAPGTGLLRPLEDRAGVEAVAVTPDGRRAVSGSYDKTLKLWDLKSGRVLRTLEGHAGAVCAVVVTPDGRRAVSGSYDKTLKLWDLESGRVLRTFEGHAVRVNAVVVTPDGQRAISGSYDKTLKVWDIESGRILRTLEGHAGSVDSVAVTPDGRCAVSGSDDNTLKVWDIETGRVLRTLVGHASRVRAVTVVPDGRHAVSGSWDNTLKVWDLESGRVLRTLAGHAGSVDAVAVTPDGRCAVSASYDDTLKVWDLETGSVLLTLEGHVRAVDAVAVTPDSQRAISGSWDNSLKVWDLGSGSSLQTLEGHSAWVSAVSVTPDGRRAVSGSWDNSLNVWDLESGRALQRLEGHVAWVSAVVITPDGQRAVSASDDKTLKVWDLKHGGALLQTLKGHDSSVRAVAVTPDGQRAISASDDKTLKIWDLERGLALQTLEGHTGSVRVVVVTPDGRCAVSVSDDETLKVWDLEGGRFLQTLKGHDRSVTAVLLTPDGRCAVSASNDTTLKVWDLKSGRVLQTLKGHTGGVCAVAMTPDGRRAVSGSYDKTLKVWDIERGSALHTLEGHASLVRSVAVTPDGRCAVSGSEDKTLKVWDLEKAVSIATFSCDSAVMCSMMAKDRLVVASDILGRVYVLALET